MVTTMWRCGCVRNGGFTINIWPFKQVRWWQTNGWKEVRRYPFVDKPKCGIPNWWLRSPWTKLPHLRLDCLSPGEIVIFLHFMVNFGDEAQLIRSWFGGTHWSQLFCCENPLIGFWPIAGQLKLEEVRSPALWWCSYVFHAMWQTQSIIHNLGRISEEVGINLLNCPLTHSWLQTLPFVGTRTSLSLRPSCRRAGS